MKKSLVLNLVQRCQNRFKNRFRTISSSGVCQFSLKSYAMVAGNNAQHAVEVTFLKILLGLKFRPKTRFFCYFLKFGSLVLLEILVEAESMKKRFGPKFGPNVSKLVPKRGFLPFPQIWFDNFPEDCIQWQLSTMSNMQSW